MPTAAGGSGTQGHWEAAKGAMRSWAYKQPSCAIAQDSLAEGCMAVTAVPGVTLGEGSGADRQPRPPHTREKCPHRARGAACRAWARDRHPSGRRRAQRGSGRRSRLEPGPALGRDASTRVSQCHLFDAPDPSTFAIRVGVAVLGVECRAPAFLLLVLSDGVR